MQFVARHLAALIAVVLVGVVAPSQPALAVVNYSGPQTINVLPNVSRPTSFAASTTNFPWVLLINYGEADAYVALGNGPATTNDYLVSVGSCLVIATGASAGVSVLAPAGYTTVRMVQADSQPGCTPAADLNFLAKDGHNAINPALHDKVLYTALICDAVNDITTGAMTSGLTTLTISDGTLFTPASVGKLIQVPNAGPQQFYKSAVIATRGSGYTAGDLLPLTGGTSTTQAVLHILAVSPGAAFTVSDITTTTMTVSAAASGLIIPDLEVIGAGINSTTKVVAQLTNTDYTNFPKGGGPGTYEVSVSQSVTGPVATTQATGALMEVSPWWPYANKGLYTAPPANPVSTTVTADPSPDPATYTGGGGSGATLTVTWQRATLTSTIAAYVDPNNVDLADQAADSVSNQAISYGTDDTAAINAAMAVGVSLPAGKNCGHASTLEMAANLDTLVGQGGLGTGVSYKTTLVWLGPTGGKQTALGARVGSAAGVTLGNLTLDGACTAGTGISMTGAVFATVYPITVRRHTSIGIMEDAEETGNTNNVGIVKWHQTLINQQNSSCGGAGNETAGLVWGPGMYQGADVFQNDFEKVNILTVNATGFVCGNNDSNNLHLVIQSGGNGLAADFLGSTTVSHGCRDIEKMMMVAPGRTVHFRGLESGYIYSQPRRINMDKNDSSGPMTTILESTSTQAYHGMNTNGRNNVLGLVGGKFSGLPSTPNDGTLAYINDCTANSAGAICLGEGTYTALIQYHVSAWRVVMATDKPNRLGVNCPLWANRSPTLTAGDVICVADPLVTSYNEAITTGSGSPTTPVLAVATGDATARVIGPLTGDASLGTDTINNAHHTSASTLTSTNSTDLTTVPDLSCLLLAGATYNLRAHLDVTGSGAGGGAKVALTSAGLLTATSLRATAANHNGATTNARNKSAGLGTAFGDATAAVTDIDIDGAIVVNEAGALNVQAAQNVADGTSLVIGVNSTFSCTRTN